MAANSWLHRDLFASALTDPLISGNGDSTSQSLPGSASADGAERRERGEPSPVDTAIHPSPSTAQTTAPSGAPVCKCGAAAHPDIPGRCSNAHVLPGFASPALKHGRWSATAQEPVVVPDHDSLLSLTVRSLHAHRTRLDAAVHAIPATRLKSLRFLRELAQTSSQLLDAVKALESERGARHGTAYDHLSTDELRQLVIAEQQALGLVADVTDEQLVQRVIESPQLRERIIDAIARDPAVAQALGERFGSLIPDEEVL